MIFGMTWFAVERDTQSSYLAVIFDRPDLLEMSENGLGTKKIRDERRRKYREWRDESRENSQSKSFRWFGLVFCLMWTRKTKNLAKRFDGLMQKGDEKDMWWL